MTKNPHGTSLKSPNIVFINQFGWIIFFIRVFCMKNVILHVKSYANNILTDDSTLDFSER
jgi:hypothetical protein